MMESFASENYGELKKIAKSLLLKERRGISISPTLLVNEAFIKLLAGSLKIQDNAHFIHLVAKAMRQVLVDFARQKRTEKRGQWKPNDTLNPELIEDGKRSFDHESILALEEALSDLEDLDPMKADLIVLRFYYGLSISELSEFMDISEATIKRHIQFAKTWLFREMNKAR